ncbi:MAG: Holliday junction resolvase RuvX [Myxococcota bacterium]
MTPAAGQGIAMGRVVGLDVGTKTIGIAVSDPTRMLASPVRTLARRSVADDTRVLAAVLAELGVDEVVVGMPYELDGSESRSARLARQIGDAVHAATGLPIRYVDERYTSVDATRQLIEAGMSRARRKQVVDQAAAVLILQSYLDHPELGE